MADNTPKVLLPCWQGGCNVAAEVVFAAPADGTPQPQCPVTVTDRGNGTHELSFVSSVVRRCPLPANSDQMTAMVATQSQYVHAVHDPP